MALADPDHALINECSQSEVIVIYSFVLMDSILRTPTA